jgi:hypothetical protein
MLIQTPPSFTPEAEPHPEAATSLWTRVKAAATALVAPVPTPAPLPAAPDTVAVVPAKPRGISDEALKACSASKPSAATGGMLAAMFPRGPGI